MEFTSNKTIAQNTLFLYFRMLLVTIVGLYTSRVILQVLGVEDFGIYNVAGSAVALFGFITGALGNASSRFITVEMGKLNVNDNSRLVSCFKTTRTIHGVLAIVILVVCETIGLFFLYRASIPDDRMSAAFWVFQISVITAMFNVTQIPYTALIIAHERMSIYAYVSIFEVLAKLAVCYLLVFSPIDRLVYYAILLFGVQSSVLLYYRYYCKKKFIECQSGYVIDKEFFSPIMSFSFWNLFGSLSSTALTQGSTLVMSFFFGPAIVASRAIANQVKHHVLNFVNNFRTAITPQILKRHAAGEEESSRKLLFFSAKFSFFLVLVFVLPLLFESRFVLELWLKDVPEYTTEFLRLVLLEMLFYVYDVCFYQIFQAEGRLKENAIICPLLDFVGLGIVCAVYALGGNVLAIAWCMLILTMSQGLLVKPWLAVRLFGYKWKDFINVFLNNLLVFVVATLLPFILYMLLPRGVLYSIIIIVLSMVSSLLSSFYIGFSKDDQVKVIQFIKSKIHKNAV